MSDTPYADAKRKWIMIAVFAVTFSTIYACTKFIVYPYLFG